MHDAIVIGAGHNGLVAANRLADAGWDVVVVEANAVCGGAVRSAEVTAPGFVNDLFSAFYPFTAASPVMSSLDLGHHGLAWTHAPTVLAHPRRDAPAALLHRDLEATIDGLERDSPGDGAAYRAMYSEWQRCGTPMVRALLAPFPPVRAAASLFRAAGLRGLRDLARTAMLPVQRFTAERFTGVAAPLLISGNALHADLPPQSSGSAIFGWMLTCLAQQVGFPAPVGGAQQLTDALVRRLHSRGGAVRVNAAVDKIEIDHGRATAVRLAGGERLSARRAILADCDASRLYLDLVGAENLPAPFLHAVHRIQRSSSTFKVDWALSQPIPWSDLTVRAAGTVHIADSINELIRTDFELSTGLVPSSPFLLLGQMTTTDPTRSPAGTEAAWAYTHVPQHITGDAGDDGITGRWDEADTAAFTERVEARIESFAPGFRDRVIARHVQTPHDMQRSNANLVGGDISGGTAQLHQQLIFRPVPGLARAETPISGLYLASASAHPGGSVHGACGNNAARAAVVHDRIAVGRRIRPSGSGRRLPSAT